MKKALMIILPLAVIALGVASAGLLIKFRKQARPQPTAPLPPLVQVIQARLQDYRFKVHAQGNVSPRTEIQIIPEVSGRVVQVSPSLAAGGFFEAGDVLFSIDSRDYELALTRAKLQLAEAKLRVEREEAEAEVAKKEWEQLGQGKPSALLLREPQLAEARAMLAAAEAAHEQAKLDIERARVKAPFDGRVAEKSVDMGQFVTKGNPAARIYAVDYAEIRLPLATDDLAYIELPLAYRGEKRVQEGPDVKLKASFAGEVHCWDGQIVRTEGQVDTRTRMMMAVARVENPYGRSKEDYQRPPLAVGLFVDAEIQGRLANNVAVLPRSALRGDDQVWVIDSEERLRIRPVEVLRANRMEAVIGSGLKDGELVCLSPIAAVTDGMKVRIQPDEERGGAP